MDNDELVELVNNYKKLQLAETTWDDEPVVGIMSEDQMTRMHNQAFFPLTLDFIDRAIEEARIEHEKIMNDPQFSKEWEKLKRQQQAAESLIRSGNLMDPEWVRKHVAVIADEEIKNKFYQDLDHYIQTPEGQANLARALVNERGGGDNQIGVEFVNDEVLGPFTGVCYSDDSLIQLSLGSWTRDNGRYIMQSVFAHELKHDGQENIPDLSPREYFLWHSGITEADARLTELMDGLAEGRNPNHYGYRGLNKDMAAVLKDMAITDIRTWDDFDRLKDTDRAKYDRILGHLKEREFSEVLHHLMKTVEYRNQGSYAMQIKGKGNLPGLRAWVEDMCKRQGMNPNIVWPEVEAMATGKEEIPGMEYAFDEKGQVTHFGKMYFEHAKEALAKGRSGVVRLFKDGGAKEIVDGCDAEEEERWYDAQGRLVETRNEDGVWRYNEEGRLISFRTPDWPNSRQFYDLRRDYQGNLQNFDLTGSLYTAQGFKEEFENGKLVGISRNGKIIERRENGMRYVCGYNPETGLLQREEVFDMYNHWSETREYDGHTGELLQEIPRAGKFTTHNGRLYCSEDDQIKMSFPVDGSHNYSMYDELGRVVGAIYEGEYRDFSRDQKGNLANTKGSWVLYTLNGTKEEFKNGEATRRTRKIFGFEVLVPRFMGGTAPRAAHENRINSEPAVSAGNVDPRKEARAPAISGRQRADKSADKNYFGNRPGGIDDTISQLDQKEHARMHETAQNALRNKN